MRGIRRGRVGELSLVGVGGAKWRGLVLVVGGCGVGVVRGLWRNMFLFNGDHWIASRKLASRIVA